MSRSDYNIFISHYHQEEPIAVAIQQLINDTYSGYVTAFLSRDIEPGVNWFKEIKDTLSKTNEIIAVFSSYSINRPWLNIETGFGIMSDKKCTPILCRGYRKSDLPVVYSIYKSIEVNDEKERIKQLYDSILSSLHRIKPNARPYWDGDKFYEQWKEKVIAADKKMPVFVLRKNEFPLVWIMGCYRNVVDKREQDEILRTCYNVARLFAKEKIQIVMGTSRMLQYLADENAKANEEINFLENSELLRQSPGEPWRKAFATVHQEYDKTVNPVILLGSLRGRSPRDVFNDAIGKIPDMALLIAGNPESNRVEKEYKNACDAGIPVLPIKFTGGLAAKVNAVNFREDLLADINRLQTLRTNRGDFCKLLLSIIQRQV